MIEAGINNGDTVISKRYSNADNGQIAVTYCDHKGNEDEKNNPNGALKNIAGIFNKDKNILGMMPHPERMVDETCTNEDGLPLFLSLMNWNEN